MSNDKHWGTEFYGGKDGKDASDSEAKEESAQATGEEAADQAEETAEQAIESEKDNDHHPSHWGIGIYGNKDKTPTQEQADK